MRHELILAVLLLLVALAGWAHRTYQYEQLRERIAPYMLKECAPPQKPARVYPLEEQV